MSDKLLPCPFCGGRATIQQDTRYPRYGKKDTVKAYEPICISSGCLIYKADSVYFLSEQEAISAWNNRTQQNEPLTLSELLEMDCKPVYCVDARGVGAWAIVSIAFEECIDGEYGGWEFYSYGWADSDAGWLAYRHKPEQEEQP